MNRAICCPRCGRRNPPVARYCANCGLCFLSAGVLRPIAPARRRQGGGVVRLVAGLGLLLLLLSGLSLVGSIMPRHVRHRPICIESVRQRTISIDECGGEYPPYPHAPTIQDPNAHGSESADPDHGRVFFRRSRPPGA